MTAGSVYCEVVKVGRLVMLNYSIFIFCLYSAHNCQALLHTHGVHQIMVQGSDGLNYHEELTHTI